MANTDSLSLLNASLGREGVSFHVGKNDLVFARLSLGEHLVETYLYGAHITSWRGPQGENLFLSSSAHFGDGKPIRGGVPLCFPQFAKMGDLPQHGFARIAPWTAVRSAGSASEVSVTLQLDDSHGQLWQGKPTLSEFTVILGSTGSLTMELNVHNSGPSPIEFTEALHTYLKVSSIDQVRIEGLSGLHYLDKVRDMNTFVEERDIIHVEGETDRVYMDCPPRILVKDIAGKKTFILDSLRHRDAVVWNPGAAKMETIADLSGYDFVCVEAANVSERVVVGAGESAIMSQTISVEHHS